MNNDDPNKYTLRKLKTVEGKYGPCEVCNQESDSFYILTKSVRYFSKVKQDYSYYHAGSIFGHKKCLENQMKPFDNSLSL